MKKNKKTCSTCNIEKKLGEFSARKSSKDGKDGRCKECRNKSDRSRRALVKTLINAQPMIPESEVQSEVKRRLRSELEKKRRQGPPFEQQVQIRAYRELAELHPAEFSRIVKKVRRLLVVRTKGLY